MHPKFCSFSSVPLGPGTESSTAQQEAESQGQASLGGRKGLMTREDGVEAMSQKQIPKMQGTVQTTRTTGMREAGLELSGLGSGGV